jgi:hypothetical protein
MRAGLQAGLFPPTTRLSLPFLEMLYHTATGKDPEFAAKQYAKSLAKKQATSTQATPGVAPNAVSSGPVKSIADAFAAAKRAHGIA